MIKYKFETNILLYVVKVSNRQIFGISTNLEVICVEAHDLYYFKAYYNQKTEEFL